jgi:hypothetical protein
MTAVTPSHPSPAAVTCILVSMSRGCADGCRLQLSAYVQQMQGSMHCERIKLTVARCSCPLGCGGKSLPHVRAQLGWIRHQL